MPIFHLKREQNNLPASAFAWALDDTDDFVSQVVRRHSRLFVPDPVSKML